MQYFVHREWYASIVTRRMCWMQNKKDQYMIEQNTGRLSRFSMLALTVWIKAMEIFAVVRMWIECVLYAHCTLVQLLL